MTNKPLNNLLQKKVTRREFLTIIGAGALAVTGVSGLMKTLRQHQISPNKSELGFGEGAYGGKKQS